MNKRLNILIVISILLFSACEEVIELDINQSQPQLIIDALLTDEDTTHYVRITTSAEFGNNEVIDITNGIVEVKDELGNIYNYTHNPFGIDSLQGYYFSDIPFPGREYGIYELEISLDGNRYYAQDTLRPISEIDSLVVEIDPFASFIPDNDDMIYQVMLYADEPDETTDYYYFRFYRDNVIEAGDQVYAFDDKFLNGSLNGLPSPINFREGELASVEIYSLTRQQYIYFVDLSNLLNNDGGMFSPPPANPRTNIQGGALGLFQVSGIRRGSILIEP